jgi:glycine/D-amino acid oxidase-like deaminating enzyme
MSFDLPLFSRGPFLKPQLNCRMTHSAPFKCLIIGKGLVGSAAARHLSRHMGEIAIIGPDEPSQTAEPLVHAAHYDQARVQRLIGWDEMWTTLNRESLKQYEGLAATTGMDFHQGVGCLYVDPYGGDAYLERARLMIATGMANARMFGSGTELKQEFPDFRFPPASIGMYEPSPSGHINPRLLVRAQLVAAERQGTTILRETVIGLEERKGLFTAVTREGNRYSASQVLVATGSFANHLDILPRKLHLKSKGETVLLVRTDGSTTNALAGLPSLLYEMNEPGMEGIYLLPPVAYPDGNSYLKIGCNFPEDPVFEHLEQIRDWFIEGDSDRFAPRLIRALSTLMPGLPIGDYMTKRCIVSYTPDRRPFIGEAGTKGLFVAGGCNGYSAMCSDAIGRVASDLMLNGSMPFGLEPGHFRLRYAG